MEKITLAAGCFWGVEAAFRQTPGVLETAVGYSGGHSHNPTYEDVCTGRTGHAEAVQVAFDPHKVSHAQLLNIFWQCHDPTQVNRQGPDVGTQYRSVIFYHSPQQAEAAHAAKAQLQNNKRYSQPIATDILPASTFYNAEEYHQQYLEKRGMAQCPWK